MNCVSLARSRWALDEQKVLLVHGRYSLKCFLLAIIKSVLVSLNEAQHVLMAISIELILRSFNLFKCPDWIQNNVMRSVKLAFLDRQKLADNCC